MYKFCVFLEKPKRVDMFVSALFPDFSRSYVQRMIDNEQLSVNGKSISKNLKVKNKDEIVIKIVTKTLEEVLPEKMSLDIVYEDDDILIVNKEAGVNVHPVPGEGGKSGTLVNAVLYHCQNKLPSINGVERPGIVHRLDKDTSGLIMIAKTDKMMKHLSTSIHDKEVGKYYLAVVFGKVKDRKFTIESYIGRDPNNRKRMTSQNPVNPKIAITHGKIIDYIANKYTLVKVRLETGRTHQIRVHLASIGYPIIGDKTYGNPKANKEAATRYQIHRQALHAYELELSLYGKDQKFTGKLKDDMKRIIGDLI